MTIIDFDEGDLEAELLALTGGARGHHEKHMSLSDIDSMVVNAENTTIEESMEDDISDVDENDLLSELKVYYSCIVFCNIAIKSITSCGCFTGAIH